MKKLPTLIKNCVHATAGTSSTHHKHLFTNGCFSATKISNILHLFGLPLLLPCLPYWYIQYLLLCSICPKYAVFLLFIFYRSWLSLLNSPAPARLSRAVHATFGPVYRARFQCPSFACVLENRHYVTPARLPGEQVFTQQEGWLVCRFLLLPLFCFQDTSFLPGIPYVRQYLSVNVS